jgi:hypothetical protein
MGLTCHAGAFAAIEVAAPLQDPHRDAHLLRAV